MALSQLLAGLRADGHFMANVTAWRTLPARPARTVPCPSQLHPHLQAALAERGITQLYAHQAEAWTHAAAGHHVVIVTPTASGKTLCYNLPILHTLLERPEAHALYLFPTKSLAQDQLDELDAWRQSIAQAGVGNAAAPLIAATYDGDTPGAHRTAIRRQTRLLLTNPDMLHAGILPAHPTWADFLAGLRYVVIDELHSYRGVFGSQVANVLRRLRRICAFYGSYPQFICTSATIANPAQLATQLIEQPVQLITENGAPSAEKHVILYNPPIYDPDRGLRRSSVLEAQTLAARCVQGGVQTIVFGRSRLTTEVLLTYLRERLATRDWGTGDRRSETGDSSLVPNLQSPVSNPPIAQLIRGYRGGYLPAERRAIEAGLRGGTVRAVVTTNALELGIDIGQLQAAILCGYPGTIASTWQQMGRAGRTATTETEDAGVAVLVATGGALDQYVIQHPEFLLERSPEHALINPDNLMILFDQMRCAAFELPFQVGESFGASPHSEAVLQLLAEQGDLRLHGSRYFWAGAGYPARQVSLRSTSSDTVTIQVAEGEEPGARPEGTREERGVERSDNPKSPIPNPKLPSGPQVLGTVDQGSAPFFVHPGAIYLHEGQSYQVEGLDLAHKIATVTPTRVDYYTEAATETAITVLVEHERRTIHGAWAAHGELQVQSQVIGFRRIKRFTHETIAVETLDYPPVLTETSGYWIKVGPAAQQQLEAANQWYDSLNDYGPNWPEQRQRVRARDGHRCTQCGAAEPPGRQHDVHHLTPFRTFGYVRGLNEQYLQANRLENLTLVCRTCHRRLEVGVRVHSGLDGLAYALTNLAPLHLMCDPQDIGVTVVRAERSASALANEDAGTGHAADTGLSTIYLYERIMAGLGFSARLYELHDGLLAAAQTLVRQCPCPHGCPACVGPILEGAHMQLPTKQLTLALLAVLQTGQVSTIVLPSNPGLYDEVAFY
jgi:DEAD/DEAH box helicase domain-containing protein